MAESNDFNHIFKFTWIIDNISLWSCWHEGYIYSPEYTVQNMDQSQWFIRLYHCRTRNIIIGSLHRSASDSATELIELEFKIEIEYSKNKILLSDYKRGNFKKNSFENFNSNVSAVDIFNYTSTVKNYLTIRCFMTSEAYKNKKSMHCFARSTISYDRTCFKWTLCCLDSTTFSASKNFHYLKQKPMFEIKIETRASEDYFEIFIHKLCDFEDFKGLTCRFTVLNTSEADEISEIYYLSWFKDGKLWKLPKFLEKSILRNKKLIDLNDNFELFCDFYISRIRPLSEIHYYEFDTLKSHQLLFKNAERKNGDYHQLASNDAEQINNSDTSKYIYHTGALIEDLSAMLNNNTETDTILKIGEEKFPAHKCILSTRSPVFKVMFQQEMLEKESGFVQIQDLDTETLKSFLEYLYTGTITTIEADLAYKLILAAEKYQVDLLKKLCIDFLIPSLTVQNVCEVVLLADMVSEQTLKSAAINYIKDHVAEVVSSPQWSDCTMKNPLLSVEVMRDVLSLPKQT